MTLYQFNRLHEFGQLETIWDCGVEIADREDEQYRYVLYQLDAFYVEELWHKRYKVRRSLHAFSSNNLIKLKPYLNLISLCLGSGAIVNEIQNIATNAEDNACDCQQKRSKGFIFHI